MGDRVVDCERRGRDVKRSPDLLSIQAYAYKEAMRAPRNTNFGSSIHFQCGHAGGSLRLVVSVWDNVTDPPQTLKSRDPHGDEITWRRRCFAHSDLLHHFFLMLRKKLLTIRDSKQNYHHPCVTVSYRIVNTLKLAVKKAMMDSAVAVTVLVG